MRYNEHFHRTMHQFLTKMYSKLQWKLVQMEAVEAFIPIENKNKTYVRELLCNFAIKFSSNLLQLAMDTDMRFVL